MGMLKRSHNTCLVKGLFASLAVTCLIGLYYGYRLMVSNEAKYSFGRNAGEPLVESEEGGPPGSGHSFVNVLLVTSNAGLGGAVAAMVSAARNSRRPSASLRFHVVTDNATQFHLHAWMHQAQLATLQYQVLTFPQASLVTPDLTSTLQSRYSQLLDLSQPSLRDLGLAPNECLLNLGVFVVRMAEWVRLNVTETAESWLRLNLKEKIFKQEGPLGPLLLALHNRTDILDHEWHVRNLGVTPGTQYSRVFVTSAAKLLQWSGRFKPWNSRSPYADIWFRYFVPDPTGRFRPASRGGASPAAAGQRSPRPSAGSGLRHQNSV